MYLCKSDVNYCSQERGKSVCKHCRFDTCTLINLFYKLLFGSMTDLLWRLVSVICQISLGTLCQCKKRNPLCDIKQVCMYFMCCGYYKKGWPSWAYLLYACTQVMISQRLQNLGFSDRTCIDKILLEGGKHWTGISSAVCLFVYFLFAMEILKSFASKQILGNTVT